MGTQLMPLSFWDSALENFTSISPRDPAQPPKDEAQCSMECIQETGQLGKNSFTGAELGALPTAPHGLPVGKCWTPVSLSDLLWEMGTMLGLSSPGCPWLGSNERGSASTELRHRAHSRCSVNVGYYQPVLKTFPSCGA